MSTNPRQTRSRAHNASPEQGMHVELWIITTEYAHVFSSSWSHIHDPYTLACILGAANNAKASGEIYANVRDPSTQRQWLINTMLMTVAACVM